VNGRNTEAPEVSPDELEVLLVDRLEGVRNRICPGDGALRGGDPGLQGT
jgi:hypothetical protein